MLGMEGADMAVQMFAQFTPHALMDVFQIGT